MKCLLALWLLFLSSIGGLLARTDHTLIALGQSPLAASAYYHSDGIGNVTALMDGNGDVVARYLYNPFGRLVGKWGSLADANTMRRIPVTPDATYGHARHVR